MTRQCPHGRRIGELSVLRVYGNYLQGHGAHARGAMLWASLNACSYDSQSYYFVYYKPPPFKDLLDVDNPVDSRVEAKGI